MRALQDVGADNLILKDRASLDLTRQQEVENFFRAERPQVVVFAAARVGGILANKSFPAEFILQNLSMAVNVVQAAIRTGVQRLLYMGSTCAYPANARQPICESELLNGPLETSNEAYAVAKLAGIKLCQHVRAQHGLVYHTVMPTNLYGPGDRYDAAASHVIPALIQRFHEAKIRQADSVSIWGTGRQLRDFLHVDDLANAVLKLLQTADPPDVVNVGSGREISVRDLAELIADVVGFCGEITTDETQPEGVTRKLADTRRIESLGWRPEVPLRDGLAGAYQDFLSR